MPSQALVIARREFLERVRTIWFAIVTFLVPVGMVATIGILTWITVKQQEEKIRVQVIDHSGRVAGRDLDLAIQLKSLNIEMSLVDVDTPERVLLERIEREEIDGYLELPEDVVDTGIATYRGDNAANKFLMANLENVLTVAVQRVRGVDLGLEKEQVDELVERVAVNGYQDTGSGKAASGGASFFLGYSVMLVLYMAILLYAVNVLRSVVMEKTSRVVELVVSSVRSHHLMLGKITGVAGVGVVQLTIWAVIAVVLIHFREPIVAFFGIEGAGAIDVPDLKATDLLISLAYFILGFFFYASLYAAIGAMCNSEQEAQQAQTPLMLLLVIPAISVQVVAGDPRGLVAGILTQVPFSSPILMPMRYLLGGAPMSAVLLSIAILAVSTVLAVLLAARIYRVGILMTGARPSLRELGRWLRA